MPKRVAPGFADRLIAEIARHPQGIAAGSLARRFARHASRRSLARYLDRLLKEGRIAAKGAGRATRYLSTGAGPPPAPPPEREAYVPLTGDSPRLRDLVCLPLAERQPVGYNRLLLDGYRPNATFYLDAGLRARLREIGRSPLGARPAGTYARDILNRLLIDLSWASSRLEGNTYSRLDTQNLIEQGRAAEGKDRAETQMILNHKQAIEFLVEHAHETGFDMLTFMNLHALLSENLLGNPADEGRLRQRIVDIGGTVYRPIQFPQQIEELFRLILEKAGAIEDPFEQAFFVMVHIPYLQPFVDVNKRVSRLAANIPLIRANLCPLSFVDVPERAYVEGILAAYEHARVDLLRDAFVWAYERSCQSFRAIAGSLPEPDPFRLRYRAEIAQAVGRIVRSGKPTRVADVRNAAADLVAVEDRERFASMVSAELRHLHEGSLARYKLRSSEFKAWRKKQAKP